MRTQVLGRVTEMYVAIIVRLHGYRVIARNYACVHGEIDIVAQRRAVLAFIEVRFRRGAKYGDGLESVDKNKQQRIYRTALNFLRKYPVYNNFDIRFDVASVGVSEYVPHLGLTVRWTRNAFESNAFEAPFFRPEHHF